MHWHWGVKVLLTNKKHICIHYENVAEHEKIVFARKPVLSYCVKNTHHQLYR